MKINNNLINTKEFIKLIELNDDNLFVNDLINEALDNRFDINKEVINERMNEEGITSKDSMNEIFLENLNLELNKYTLKKLKEYELDDIKELNPNDYLSNEYYKNIKVKEINFNGYHLYYKKYLPYEIFIYDDIKEVNFKEINRIGYFKEEFNLLSIDKNDETWMLISPHEINTMKDYISKMKGNCLIYGLGLGYFPYMLSLKEDVSKITILEKDPSIIKLFKENIFPLFKNKEKIEIIECDAVEYSDNLKKNNIHYDYHFIDLWHNQLDALEFYLYFKKNEIENDTYFYWIEDSIMCYIRRMLITLFIEYKEGFNEKNYKKASTFEDKVINSLYFYLKNNEFNTMDDIYSLLSKESIKTIVKNLRIFKK